jgi:flavin reductase (DIM6/NTAB) family NADH-FMN oxidoreductase RutF
VIPLPSTAKRWVRSLVNLPRYGPLGLGDPQQEVEVWLEGHGEPRDVTRNNVVTALRPFTIGVMFDDRTAPSGPSALRLTMRERGGPHRLLGVIHLRLVRSLPLAAQRFCLFETPGCENYCVSAANLRLYYLREKWRAERRQRRDPYNFRMTTTDLHCSYVFYICPRPVVLVTAEHEGAGNMFPMDLIGPTDSPWFSMALRSTSPAVRLMQQSRRMALAGVPFPYKDFAYELGKHHRKPSIDWASLPFPTQPSPVFGLPVAQAALRVREVRVDEFHEVGSHVLFLTSIVNDTLLPESAGGLQMFHAFSSYRRFRAMARSRV